MFCDDFLTGVITHAHLFVGSSYLPDSWKPINEFIHALERVQSGINNARHVGARHFVLAGDVNICFDSRSRQLELVSACIGPCVFPAEGLREPGWSERHQVFLDFCFSNTLSVSDTFLPHAN